MKGVQGHETGQSFNAYEQTPPLNVHANISVTDPEGVQGVRSNPILATLFKYPMKMNNLVSMRPNYFIFMEYLRKKR